MAHKTALDKLNEALTGILTEYGDDISANVSEIAKAMGRKGVQALKQKSRETFPVEPGTKITGQYAQGWTYQTEDTRTGTTVTIYNKHPALPHLLEHGHVTRNGTGRVYPRTPAHEHIKPVADELIDTFESEVRSKL